jgi:putative endonuclease
VPRRLTKVTLQALDWLIMRTGRAEVRAEHQQTGRRGEEAAYFHLRQLGYVVVARNFRSPRRRGEIDMVAWNGDVLCFVEVKTRTTRDVKPAHVAVDREKQRELIGMAREYLHHVRGNPPWRVDIVSVYFEGPNTGQGVTSATKPQIELFKNAFPVS